jgi:hypothetical protein
VRTYIGSYGVIDGKPTLTGTQWHCECQAGLGFVMTTATYGRAECSCGRVWSLDLGETGNVVTVRLVTEIEDPTP